MMISHRSWLSVTAALAAAVAFSAACSSGSKKKATPTPTPLQLSIPTYYSSTNSKVFHPGECAGFKVTDATAQLNQNTVAFLVNASGLGYSFVSNQLNQAGAVLAINSSGTYMTVGGGLEYPCITWGLDATPGPYDFTVISPITTTTTAEGIVADAVEFDNNPLPVMNLGTAFGSGTGSLSSVHDTNYWNFTAGHNRTVLEISSTDTSGAFTPFQYAFLPDYSSFFNEGFDAAIQPGLVANVAYRNLVTNYWGGTEAAWPYTLTLSTSAFATANSGADTCALADTAPMITTFPDYIVGSNNNMGADYNPAGSAGCANYYFKWFAPYTPGHPNISDAFGNGHANSLVDGDGLYASGKDSVYKVLVPGHKSLIVGMTGFDSTSKIDSAVYVLMATGAPTTDCPATPGASGKAQCLAANDTFGDVATNPGTDALHWYNSSAAPQAVYVVVDAFGGDPNGTTPQTGKYTLFIDAK